MYVYRVHLRFPSKLINERQTAGSLSVDNTEESQVTTVEQYTKDKNNFSQETSFRKPRTEQCGKRICKQTEFELRNIKALEEGNQPNRHLSFSTDITPSHQNLEEEESLEFQMGFLQLIANIKHRKPRYFPSQLLPM